MHHHYENTPMQDAGIFHGCKNDSFQLIYFYYFQIFAQNIYCGYTLDEAVLTSTHNICFNRAKIMEFIFVLNVVCLLQGGCSGWIIDLGFLIAHRVWVSDILFLVFHEKVI